MYPLLHAADPQLCEWLRKAALQPYFALAWLITWWAHDVHELAVRKNGMLGSTYVGTTCYVPHG